MFGVKSLKNYMKSKLFVKYLSVDALLISYFASYDGFFYDISDTKKKEGVVKL